MTTNKYLLNFYTYTYDYLSNNFKIKKADKNQKSNRKKKLQLLEIVIAEKKIFLKNLYKTQLKGHVNHKIF